MRPRYTLIRMMTVLAVGGMVLASATLGRAQGVGEPEVTPALRVARLAWAQGEVSFHAADQENWSPAVVNYPVSLGDALWTQSDATAGLQVADTLVALNGATELDINTFDTRSFVATEPQGDVYVQTRSLLPGETYTVETPRGTVTIATPGRYEIAAGSTQGPTLVTVLEGAAQVSGAVVVDVTAGQTAVITGDQVFDVRVTSAMRDAFLDAMLARERQQVRPAAVAVPAVVQQMPGGSELAAYGSWQANPEYGQVWYPRVAAGWEPYREGHWAYVAPWGWTWVDAAPWGFAPFHYGRWAELGGRWAWIPAGVAVAGPPVPVYAPALVAFFGGVATGALLSGSVGWVPLGPREVYRPWFHASPTYVREVNVRHVTNITRITTISNVTINNYHNARAAVVVPASVMATSRPVRGYAHTAQAAELAQARPVVGHAPLRPTTATLGMTPALARRVNATAPPAGYAASPRPAAPGPVIHGTLATATPGHPALQGAAPEPPIAHGPRTPGEPPALGRAERGGTNVAPPPRTPGATPAETARPGVATATPASPSLPGAHVPAVTSPEAPRSGRAAAHPGMPALRPPGGASGAHAPVGTPSEAQRPGVATAHPSSPALRTSETPLPGVHAPVATPPGAPRPGVTAAHPGAPAMRPPGHIVSGEHGPAAIPTEASRPSAGAAHPSTPTLRAPGGEPASVAAPHAAQPAPHGPTAVREPPRAAPTPHPTAPPPQRAAAGFAPPSHEAPRFAPAPQPHPAPRPEPPYARPPTPVHVAPPPAPHPAPPPQMHAAAPPPHPPAAQAPRPPEAHHVQPQNHEKRPGER